MSDHFPALDDNHSAFIKKQQLFFVGTACNEGRVNVSPKGMDTLRILSPNRIVWLNLTGSGNESAAHIRENPRMTLMWCSFSKQPLILRVYGCARVYHPGDESWTEFFPLFDKDVGARQIFDLDIDLVQTSCGYAVPHFEFASERKTLANWAEKKGSSGITDYWQEKNQLSIDGLETGILSDK